VKKEEMQFRQREKAEQRQGRKKQDGIHEKWQLV
jgi:hypothetical protein